MTEPERGIECVRCGCRLLRVVKTIRVFGHIRRRRVCEHCGRSFYTIETAIGWRKRRSGDGPERETG